MISSTQTEKHWMKKYEGDWHLQRTVGEDEFLIAEGLAEKISKNCISLLPIGSRKAGISEKLLGFARSRFL